MATEVKLPQWAMTLGEGTVVEWKKQVGDFVQEGDPLCEIEESKVSQVLSSPVTGTLLEICVDEEETVPVLTTICVIGEAGEPLEAA